MAESDWKTLEDGFAEAVELKGEERQAYLADFEASHPALIAQLRQMLSADETRSDEITHSIRDALAGVSFSDIDMSEGNAIGPWTISRKLGSGGMGAVYLVERSGEFEQLAAIKVMNSQFLVEHAVRRFEAERQILARLRHPYIATLIDGGATDRGLPFLVMEYVEGEPIDAWCEARNSNVADRLRLFRKVCAAVEFAHRNLVIHRDLKPANILVDDEGNPKLLDFGIAKLLDEEATSNPRQTAAQERVLTLEYASPEQIRGEPVTTSSDVYSLGLILCRLLTGKLPYGDIPDNPREFETVILEREPATPSQIVDTAGLRKDLRGDLDNITLKCLQKDPERRYASVQAIREDIERHLKNEPVLARGVSWGYLTGKFIRRNRWALAAASAGLSAAIGLSIWYTISLAKERDEARFAAAQAREVSTFLETLFESASPATSQGETITAIDLLRSGEERIGELSDQPRLQGELTATIARSYNYLGDFEKAAAVLDGWIAKLKAETGDPGDLLTDALLARSRVKVVGEYDATIDAAKEAIERIEKSSGTEDPRLIDPLLGLGSISMSSERFEESLGYLERAAALDEASGGPDWERTLDINHNLANTLDYLGEYDRSEALYRENIAISENKRGRLHPDTIIMHADLALMLVRGANYEEAYKLFSEAAARAREAWPEGHPYIVAFSREEALSKLDVGLFDEARRAGEQTIAAAKQLDDPSGTQLGLALRYQGRILVQAGAFDEAEAVLDEALRVAASLPDTDGRNYPALFTAYANQDYAQLENLRGDYLAAEARAKMVFEYPGFETNRKTAVWPEYSISLSGQGRFDEAEEAFAGTLKTQEEDRGADSPLLVPLLTAYARHLLNSGKADDALAMATRAYELGEAALPKDNWQTALAETELAYAQTKLEQEEEAKAHAAHALSILQPILPVTDPRVLRVGALLVDD